MLRTRLPMLTCLVLFATVAFGARAPIARHAEGALPGVAQAPTAQAVQTATVAVDCDGPDSYEGSSKLAKILAEPNAARNLTIRLSGTCEEDILIERSGVTLMGEPRATLIGGIRVNGSTRVTIANLDVVDNEGFEGAIEAVAGSAIKIDNVTVDNAISRGVRIRDSAAELFNVAITNSGTVGLLARGAQLTLEGTITVADSNESNIILTDNTSVFSRDGEITAAGGEIGMIVQTGSSFEGVFGSYTGTGNIFAGLLVATQGVFVYGFDLTLSFNGFTGLWVDESSSFSPFVNLAAETVTTLNDNAVVGVFIQRSSTVELAGNTNISGNVFGVAAEESVFKTAGANITGNEVLDVMLDFATRATFEPGNTIGSMTCAVGVLTRGELACPEGD